MFRWKLLHTWGHHSGVRCSWNICIQRFGASRPIPIVPCRCLWRLCTHDQPQRPECSNESAWARGARPVVSWRTAVPVFTCSGETLRTRTVPMVLWKLTPLLWSMYAIGSMETSLAPLHRGANVQVKSNAPKAPVVHGASYLCTQLVEPWRQTLVSLYRRIQMKAYHSVTVLPLKPLHPWLWGQYAHVAMETHWRLFVCLFVCLFV